MIQEENVRIARELMGRVEEESEGGGNEMVAAEFLWGGFVYCLITLKSV